MWLIIFWYHIFISRGVANFRFNYLSHFTINFQNSGAHLAANFLNFPKHPKLFEFWWFWRELWQFKQKVPIYFKTQIRARTHVPRCPQVGEVLLRSTATDLDVRPRAGRGTETTTAWSALARSAAQCAEQCPPDLRGRRRRPVFEYFIIRKMR